MNSLLDPVRRNLVGPAIGLHPLGQRAGTAEDGVDLGVGGAIAVLVAPADVDVEVGPNLLDEADIRTGEFAPGTFQRAQVGGNELRALISEGGGSGHRRQLAEQPPGRGGQLGRIGRGLVGHRSPQPRVPGERVDVALLDPVEPQTEHEVLAN